MDSASVREVVVGENGTQCLSAARTALSRMDMMTLVDSEGYGNFKVLAQAKGNAFGIELLGSESQRT